MYDMSGLYHKVFALSSYCVFQLFPVWTHTTCRAAGLYHVGFYHGYVCRSSYNAQLYDLVL